MLASLCAIAGLGIAGPSGLLAWSENLRLKDERSRHLAALQKERDVLAHRVELLDPDKSDADLVGELIRDRLNVLHPDEFVIVLEPVPEK